VVSTRSFVVSLKRDAGIIVTSDDDESDSDEVPRHVRRRIELAATSATSVDVLRHAMLVHFVSAPTFKLSQSTRIQNSHGSREDALEFARSWSDEVFEMMFRLCREDFYVLVEKIEHILEPNHEMARRSSGSPIRTEMRLMITLRILAGASYLDMIWFRVSIFHVIALVVATAKVINEQVDNIHFPQTEAECVAVAQRWREIQVGRWGHNLTPGTIAAGDGLVIQITEPRQRELAGKDSAQYLNRKGYFALVAAGFCDADCHLIYFAINWPGGTNDCTAYEQTSLYRNIRNLPPWVHFVLDEAYASFGGIHLTPFSKDQLKKAKAQGILVGDMTVYHQMCAFNNVLSGQRISIERVFGMVVRRWGILWSAQETTIEHTCTLVTVCAKLHNVCVDRWIARGWPGGGYPRVPEQRDIPLWNDPSERDVKDRLNNEFLGEPRHISGNNALRSKQMQDIWNCGIRQDSTRGSEDFLQSLV
jgi:hypothetical protein